MQNLIGELRALNSQSREDLAFVLGVDVSTIARWETGSRSVPDRMKTRIARHFGWPVHRIFIFEEETSDIHMMLRAVLDQGDKQRVAS